MYRFLLLCFLLGTLCIGCMNSSETSSIPVSLPQEMVRIQGGPYSFPIRTEYGQPVSFEGNMKDFYVGKFELTQQEWKAVMGELPANLNNPESASHPIEMVNWNEVQAFIEKLNQQTGNNYRLPTALEWEYAARGGQKTQNFIYSGSNDPAHETVWHGGSIPSEKYAKRTFTMAVGTKKPNELGLYDMSGNVREWVSDCVGKRQIGVNYFIEGTKFPIVDSCDMHMTRGGGATDWIYDCTVVFRKDEASIFRSPILGFRLAHDAE